jgi:AmmeMemoRadiSam system protein A
VSPETGKVLLQLARETVAAHLSGGQPPPLPNPQETSPAFGGAFVTLRAGGRLRGCIGRFNPEGSLAETVQAMAIASLSDPRFRHCPVTLEELGELRIEISVLSRMVRTREPLSLVPAVHGVYIRQGINGGCFLPQVASEQKWDRETFLSRCCADKAGLPSDAWKDPQTEVYLFTCHVLEEELREKGE